MNEKKSAAIAECLSSDEYTTTTYGDDIPASTQFKLAQNDEGYSAIVPVLEEFADEIRSVKSSSN